MLFTCYRGIFTPCNCWFLCPVVLGCMFRLLLFLFITFSYWVTVGGILGLFECRSKCPGGRGCQTVDRWHCGHYLLRWLEKDIQYNICSCDGFHLFQRGKLQTGDETGRFLTNITNCLRLPFRHVFLCLGVSVVCSDSRWTFGPCSAFCTEIVWQELRLTQLSCPVNIKRLPAAS